LKIIFLKKLKFNKTNIKKALKIQIIELKNYRKKFLKMNEIILKNLPLYSRDILDESIHKSKGSQP
jgi:hypothetical protein